jgi:hypothetical protein
MYRSLILLLVSLSCFQSYSQPTNANYGALAPNVKVVDIDDIYSISSEICIVSKGDKTALMDINGNIITPWGKYSFINTKSNSGIQHFIGGLVKVRNNLAFRVGFVNNKGVEIIPVQFFEEELGNFDVKELCPMKKRTSRTTTFLNTKGTPTLTVGEDKYYFFRSDSYHEMYLKEKKEQKLFLLRNSLPLMEMVTTNMVIQIIRRRLLLKLILKRQTLFTKGWQVWEREMSLEL